MGRPRKSAEEHLRNGTFRPSRGHVFGSLVVAPDDVPEKPDHLPPEVAGCWDELFPLVASYVRRLDGLTLEQMCWWLNETRRIRAVLDGVEMGSAVYHRLFRALAIASERFHKLAVKFGLDPMSRARLPGVAPAAPVQKVAVRPRTALDLAPPPILPPTVAGGVS